MSAERPAPDGGFSALIDELRELLDATCAAAAPDELNQVISEEMRRLASLLRPYAVAGDAAPAGQRPDLPGEGHPLRPPTVIKEWLPDRVRAEVTFSRAHVGSGNAVHGGVPPLVYDDVLGRLAQRVAASVARTAYLRVAYRLVTPVDRTVVIEGGVEKYEGRKIYTWGRMTDGDLVLTTAEALFVVAREAPGIGCARAVLTG